MAAEQFFTDPVAPATTLGAAISSALSTTTPTSFTVGSSTGFTATTGKSQFRVRIDNEIILVSNVSGTTWLGLGGQDGTTATTHLNGAAVTHVLTGAALRNPSSGLAHLPGLYPSSGGRFLPYNCTSNGTGGALSRADATLIVFGWDVTISELAFQTGSAVASAKMRLGVYGDNGSLYPGKLLYDSGQIACVTSGEFIQTGVALALKAGIYWLVTCPQGVLPGGLFGMEMGPLPIIPFGDVNSNYGYISNTGSVGGSPTCYSLTSITAALPDPFTAGATQTSVGNGGNTSLIYGKVA